MAVSNPTSTEVQGSGASSTVSGYEVTGADPVLVVTISTRGSGITVSSVTWNGSGVGFTEVVTDINNDARASIWVLPNPTATTADIVVTLSGSSRHIVGAQLATDVDGSTPVFASNINNGTDNAPTTSLTGNTDGMLIDCLSQVSGGPDTATKGASTTEQYNLAETGGGSDTRGCSQYWAATGGSQAMDWSMSSTDSWAICAIALQVPFVPPAGHGALLSNLRNRLVL